MAAKQPDPSSLVAGHATATLSEAERRRLYHAALSDQEVFDQLVEEEGWRRIFDAPGVRGELLEALTDPAPASPRPGERLRRWLDGLMRPVPLALGTAAAALLVIALIPRWLELGVPGPITLGPVSSGPVVPGPAAGEPVTPNPVAPDSTASAPVASAPVASAPVASAPVVSAPVTPAPSVPVSEPPAAAPSPAAAAPAAELVPKSLGQRPSPAAAPAPVATRSLRPESAGERGRRLSYTLELNQPGGPRPVSDGYAFRPGDQFRLRVDVDFTAWLYLFNRAAGEDAYSVLYPHTEREREPRPPSENDFLLPAGVWLTMDDTPEDEQLVLVVASRPWPAVKPAAGEVPAAELDAALERAESRFQALSWRRSEVEDRVRWTVAESGDDLTIVVRLLAR